MANQWVRLWLDMPTCPKFRAIARASGQPLTAVISVFVLMMTDAANANERGRTQMNDDDVSAALDMEIEQVAAIRSAMQGRVLDGDIMTGWEARQPIREDNSSERSKAWRQKKKEETQTNANERKRTQRDAPDTDTDIKKKEITTNVVTKKNFSPPKAEEVARYAEEISRTIDAQRFVDFYEAKGWTVGKSPMKDWKAAVRNWTKGDGSQKSEKFQSWMYEMGVL